MNTKWQSCRPKVLDLTFIVYRSGYLFDFEGWSRSFDLFTTQRYSNLFRGCGIVCARLRCFPPSGRHRKVFGSFRRHGLTSDEASALPGERGLVWLAPTVAEWGRPNVFPWWSGTRANRGFRMADVFSGSVESILAAVDRQIGATVTYMLQQSVAWFRFRVIIADLLIIHQGCTPLAPRCCSIKLEQNRPPTGSPDRNPFFKRVLLLHVA